MSEKFRRTQQSFTCLQCGAFIRGDGYTNHCSDCLWSRHVDVFPGDRAEQCCGMMEPVSAERHQGEMRLIHRCVVCGVKRPNRVDPQDNFDSLLEVMSRSVRTVELK